MVSIQYEHQPSTSLFVFHLFLDLKLICDEKVFLVRNCYVLPLSYWNKLSIGPISLYLRIFIYFRILSFCFAINVVSVVDVILTLIFYIVNIFFKYFYIFWQLNISPRIVVQIYLEISLILLHFDTIFQNPRNNF